MFHGHSGELKESFYLSIRLSLAIVAKLFIFFLSLVVDDVGRSVSGEEKKERNHQF